MNWKFWQQPQTVEEFRSRHLGEYTLVSRGENDDGIEIVRIAWPDGHWWDVLGEMPYRVAKRLKRRLLEIAPTSEGDTKSLRRERLMELTDEGNEITLTMCSVGWSWDEELTAESFGLRSTNKVQDVLRAVNRLYAPQLRSEEDEEKKRNSSSPLSSSSPFRESGEKPPSIAEPSISTSSSH
jgi:hypothetical protein